MRTLNVIESVKKGISPMEKYTSPEIQIIAFDSEDVIATSTLLEDDKLK